MLHFSLYFQEIPSGSAELTFSTLFFPFSLFIVFPLSSHTVVSHLPWPSCRASGQGAESQSGWSKPCAFVFVFYLHPVLVELNLYSSSVFVCGCFLTWECHLATSLFQVTTLPPPLRKLLLPACWGGKRGEEEWGPKNHEQYSPH